MQNPCFFCGGAAHPATGCQYSEDVIVCWRCTDEAWRWVKGWTNQKGRRGGGPSFYDHVNRLAPPIVGISPEFIERLRQVLVQDRIS